LGVERELGRVIREFRRARGLTQAKLAKSAGVTVSQISNVERGDGLPSLATLYKISRAVRITLPELFRFDAKPIGQDRAGRLAKLMALADGRRPEELDLAIELLQVVWGTRRRRKGAKAAQVPNRSTRLARDS